MRKKHVLTSFTIFLVLFSGITVLPVSGRPLLGHDSAEQYFALVVDLNKPNQKVMENFTINMHQVWF